MAQAIADVAVIGAGIIGTSIAEKLQHEGKQVILIDRQQPGDGCSKGNAGHFATDIIFPMANWRTLLGVPKMLCDPLGPLSIKWSYLPQLLPWLLHFSWSAMPHKTQQSIEALKTLNRPSIDRYKQLLSRTGLQYLMTQQGALVVYHSQSAARKNKQHAKLVSQHGIQVEELSGYQIRQLEPALSHAITGGLYYPDTAHSINPHKLVTSLAEHFCNNGGRFIQQEVQALDLNNPSIIRVQTDTIDIVAKNIVIACGAWSNVLLNKIGHNVPLETERGYHLMLPAPGVNLSRPVTSFEQSFVMTPMEQGLRIAGTVELAGLETPQNDQRATALFDHALNLIPELQNNHATSWMGHRPSLPDSLPVIDHLPNTPNVLLAFGHQHLGFTQAAVTADIISDCVFNRAASVDLNPFSINRF